MPFSIFPSSYKEDSKPTEVTTSETHEELSVQLPQHERPGREGQYSSSYVVNESNNRHPYREEEVRITREEERYRRPGVRREYIREARYVEVQWTEHGVTLDACRLTAVGSIPVLPVRSVSAALAHPPVDPTMSPLGGIPDQLTNMHSSPRTTFSETSVDYDVRRDYYDSPIDIAEREYRTRYQPNYNEGRTFADATVDASRYPQQPQQSSFEDNTTVDAPFVQPQGSSFTRKSTKVVEDIVEPSAPRKTNKMGYYDEEGEFLPCLLFLLLFPLRLG